MAAMPPGIVDAFKEERCGGWGGGMAKPAVDFYHEVSPFSKGCFLFCPPAYFYLGLLGPNQLLPPLAAKKAKMVGNRIVIISRPFIAHLLGLTHRLLK